LIQNALTDPSSDVRSSAIRALFLLNTDKFVDRIPDVVEDRSPMVHLDAAFRLRGVEAVKLARLHIEVDKAARLLSSPDRGTRELGLTILGIQARLAPDTQLRDDSAAALIRALNTPDVGQLRDAIWAIGISGSTGLTGRLTPFLTDVRYDVRAEAASALLRLGSGEGLDDLVKLLASNSPDAKYSALAKLVQLTSDPNCPPQVSADSRLADILQRQLSIGPASSQGQALFILARVSRPAALQYSRVLLRDSQANVRARAAQDLPEIGRFSARL
jgi:HEAT repeat protein